MTARDGSPARTVPSTPVMPNVTAKIARAPAPLRIRIPAHLSARDGLIAADARRHLLGLQRRGRLATARALRITPTDEQRTSERRERHDARGSRVGEQPFVRAA